jgi:hypothetical protein
VQHAHRNDFVNKFCGHFRLSIAVPAVSRSRLPEGGGFPG